MNRKDNGMCHPLLIAKEWSISQNYTAWTNKWSISKRRERK